MDWKNIVLTSLIAPAVFEMLKVIVIWMNSKIVERSLPYNMSGFWCAYVEDLDENDGKIYSAYELIKMKQQKSKLIFKLFHVTNDDRFYLYKGCGYIRGEKASLSYEECCSEISSSTGTITLLKRDIYQHTPCFVGVYSEYVKEKKECTVKPYKLYYCKISIFDKLMLLLFNSNYAAKYMKKDRFLKIYEECL